MKINMKRFTPLFLFAITIFIATSCSVEKRVYNKGYHVEWKKNHKNSSQNVAQKEVEENKVEEQKSETAYLPQQNSTLPIIEKTFSTIVKNKKDSDLNNVNELALIQNSTSKSNFRSQVISKKANLYEVLGTNKSEIKKAIKSQKRQNRKKKMGQDTSGSGGKSQLIALILALVVGMLGIHRFYLGHTGIGILMLLTGGVCGVLAIIDIIRICTGDLTPKNGSYTETL